MGPSCALSLLVATAVLAGCLQSGEPSRPLLVELQILNVSDWHGQVDPIRGVGGAAVLSAYFQADRANAVNTLTLTAGDGFGATPVLVNQFGERPAVLVMNVMGFDADALGNHNFDRGLAHLQDMIDLAEFPYLSANLENMEGSLHGVRPYRIFHVDGIKVAVIGVTNPEAPTITAAGSFGPIEIGDPVAAAQKARDEAAAEGAVIFILLAHLGVNRDGEGALVDLAHGLSGFDVILGDHTNQHFEGLINGALVLENLSYGLEYARIHLVYDTAQSKRTTRTVDFIVPHAANVTPDPAVVDLLLPYRTQIAPTFDPVIATATDLIPHAASPCSVDTPLGNLVADALRTTYSTDFAIQNLGGVRSALPSSYAPLDKSLRRDNPGYAAGPPYDLVVGDIHTMLPFGERVMIRELTGQEVWQMMEQSLVSGLVAVSGLQMVFDGTRAPMDRVLSITRHEGADPLAPPPEGSPCPETLGALEPGAPPILEDDTTYTLALSEYLNGGGSGFTMFADGEGESQDVTADVVAEHLRSLGTLAPGVDSRILEPHRLAAALPPAV